MGEWSRKTLWRQGHLLPVDAFNALNIPVADQPYDTAIVVSHDCDIAQLPPAEPMVEIIPVRRVETPNGNYTHAKNSRRLHLTLSGGMNLSHIDLVATQKILVSKDLLADYSPDETSVLTPGERSILQLWLAARYRRSAFPDEFDKRLSDTGLRDRLGKILKPSGQHIVAIFFDVDEGEERTRDGADDAYSLAIYLLYSTATDPIAAEKVATEVTDQITKAFQEKCYDKTSTAWRNIELIECVPIADEAMTYAQSLSLKKWSADHISLRIEPHQPMLRE